MEDPIKIPLNLTFVRRKPSTDPPKSEAPHAQQLRSSFERTPQADQSNVDRSRIRDRFISVMEGNESMGTSIERNLYHHIMDETGRDFPNDIFRQEYLGAAHNLLENLDPEGSVGNRYLQPLVTTGHITPEALVKMSDHDLYPPKWQQIKERRLKEIKTENEMQLATSDLYKCGKCGKRETTFYQLQIRSMDEPTTSFINCVNCGHRWKD